MATMKTEVLAQRGAEHGFTLRQRAAGHARAGLAVASRAPGLVNAGRGHPRRAPPGRGDGGHRPSPPASARGRAAAPLVRGAAAGRRDRPGSPCSRTPGRRTSAPTSARPRSPCSHARARAWSCRGRLLRAAACSPKGLVEPARRSARANLDALAPLAEQGVPIVGAGAELHPHASRRLRDAAPRRPARRGRGRRDAAVGGGAARARRAAAVPCGRRRARAAARPLPPEGAGGHGPTEAALALVPGWRWDVDSGCCGMAGLLRLRARALRRVDADGGARLFGAVRGAPAATVVAPGTSCRQQIADGTGRHAVHPAEFLAARLAR